MRVGTSLSFRLEYGLNIFLDLPYFLVLVETEFLEHLFFELAMETYTDADNGVVELVAANKEVTVVTAYAHGIATRLEPRVIGIRIGALEVGEELVATHLENPEHRKAIVLGSMSADRERDEAVERALWKSFRTDFAKVELPDHQRIDLS